MCDRAGVLHSSRPELTPVKSEIAARTNRLGVRGSISDALRDADVLIGVSGGTISREAVASMDKNQIVFSLANPIPEVHPAHAEAAGAAVVATGRSDFPNQINNVLAFPGIFRGALDCGATRITEGMKLAAADAIAALVAESLSPRRIVPDPFDPRLAPAVAAAVRQAAEREGVVRASSSIG